MKNHVRFFTLAVSVTGWLLMNGCSSEGETVSASFTEEERIKTATFLLEKDLLTSSLQLPGELLAFQQVDLYAKVTGFVKELKVDIGSEVVKGQLLMTLEAPEMLSQLAAAESRIKSLEAVFLASDASYNRLLETSKTPGTVSQNDLDHYMASRDASLSNLDAAKAAAKEVTAMQAYLEIRAPFNGVITSKNVNPGAYVGPSGKGSEMPLLTLQQQDKLRLAVFIPEAFTSYLNRGDEAVFHVRSFPNRSFKAEISRLAGALDLRLRSERIEMDVANPEKNLLPGSVAEVTVPLSKTDSSFVVPVSAIITTSQGSHVIKVEEGKAVWIPVNKGRESNSRIELFAELEVNDRLITKASEEIRQGSNVHF